MSCCYALYFYLALLGLGGITFTSTTFDCHISCNFYKNANKRKSKQIWKPCKLSLNLPKNGLLYIKSKEHYFFLWPYFRFLAPPLAHSMMKFSYFDKTDVKNYLNYFTYEKLSLFASERSKNLKLRAEFLYIFVFIYKLYVTWVSNLALVNVNPRRRGKTRQSNM